MKPLLAGVKNMVLFISFTLSFFTMQAQQFTQTVTGEYYLKAVTEVASGFKLNEDSSFDFFFSYGALDRTGSGRWELQGNTVTFNSIKEKPNEFSLLESKIDKVDRVTIKIMEANPSLRSHVFAILFSGQNKVEGVTNANGEISFPRQEVDSLQLVLEFCPEKTYVFNNSLKLHNYFEFKIERGVMDVHFDRVKLTLDEEGLEGQHPLLKPGSYRFGKRK